MKSTRRRLLGGAATLPLGLASSARAEEPATSRGQIGLATSVVRQANLEGRVLWMDATANLKLLSTREGVSGVFDRCKRANINAVVVDVKPLSGHVLYNSRHAPRLKEWRGFTYPEEHDLLQVAVFEGRRRGIRVYAGVNIFCEGHKLIGSGPLYEKRDRQAQVYDFERTVTAPDGETWVVAGGENRTPGVDQMSVIDPRGEAVTPGENTALVVVIGTRVSAVLDGSAAASGPVKAPTGGHMLFGRGKAGEWLLQHLGVGDEVSYAGRELIRGILDAPSEVVGGFVNPVDPINQQYILSILEEIADSYPLDGIVLDRMRYSSIRTDFSPVSRQAFETWLGEAVEQFPQDIFTYDPIPGRPVQPGKLYKQWLHWRALVIRDFLAQARVSIRRRRPDSSVGAYVGSWYAEYYGVGVNWGAADYRAELEWMTPNYSETGYAGFLDWITTGCYYPICTRNDARQLEAPEDLTVEAAAQLSTQAVNEATFIYAGLNLLDYQGRPDDFRKALHAALENSQGVMLFDLVYLEQYGWWSILEEQFPTARRAPHDVPGLKEAILQTRKALAGATAAPRVP